MGLLRGSFTVKQIKQLTWQIDDVTRDRHIDILKLLFVCDLCMRVCQRERERYTQTEINVHTDKSLNAKQHRALISSHLY